MINRENANVTVRRAKASLKNVGSFPDPVTGSRQGSPGKSSHALPPLPQLYPRTNATFPTVRVATEPYLINVCKLLQAFVFEALC